MDAALAWLSTRGPRLRVVALLPLDNGPILWGAVHLRSEPVPDGTCWRFKSMDASFVTADGGALPLGYPWPMGPLRVVLPNGDVLPPHEWQAVEAPWSGAKPLPAGARFECPAVFEARPGGWRVSCCAHLEEEAHAPVP